MKKTLIMALLSVATVSASRADIAVNFAFVQSGIGNLGGTTVADLVNGSLFVELLWSPAALSFVPTYTPGTPDAGHFVLFSGNIGTSAGFADAGDIDGTTVYNDADVGGGSIDSGFLYGKFFNDQTVPTEWTFIDSIAPVAIPAVGPPPTPADLDLYNSGSIDASYASAFDSGNGINVTALQVVPEPSVLAFLGLGGLALAARRRFTA